MAEACRRFLGVLYPDSTTYNCDDVLQVIREYFDEWAFVTHDLDVDPATGEKKKDHIHWVGSLAYPVNIQTVINRLEVPANSVEYIRKNKKGSQNWKGAVRYLVHDANPEKAQYDVSKVESNFNVTKFLGSIDGGSQFMKILEFLQSNPGVTYQQLAMWSYANGCYSEFLRSFRVIEKIQREIKEIGVVKA